MKRFLTIFLLLTSLFCFSQPDLNVQTNEITQINELENIVRQFNYSRNTEPKEVTIEGSAYLEEDFVKGTVVLSTGAIYTHIPLRLNIYNEEIEFRNQSGKVFNINNPAGIRKVTMGDTKFIYTESKFHKENKKILAEIITEGTFSLLKHHRVKLTEGRPAQTHRAVQPPRLVKMPSEYMIRKNNGIAEPFKNEKELLSLLSDKRDKAKEFISRQKLSVKNEHDLVSIIKYINEN